MLILRSTKLAEQAAYVGHRLACYAASADADHRGSTGGYVARPYRADLCNGRMKRIRVGPNLEAGN